MSDAKILEELYQVILDRKQNPKEGSYTNYLFQKGQDKILKKVGEEAAETIIASKNNDNNEIIYEASDLLYHLLVLLANHGIKPQEIYSELAKRRQEMSK
jgi:phosphoribosyl-ATP pyrophosphohydrolase/phosphoribosyl-AMP cyclohydrolase